MGHKLRTIEYDDGRRLYEKACENYQCASCGCKMVSCNFVNGVCIQVFASHREECRKFLGNAFTRTAEVSCSTCRYYSETYSCTYSGKQDEAINSCRTGVSSGELVSGGI